MKLHFEPDLDCQLQAIEAVCDLFRGQEICRTEFTVTMRTGGAQTADDLFPGSVPQQLTLGVAESDLGMGNRLTLLDDELLKNLGDIQLRHGLPRPARSPRATSPWRWRPAPGRPTSTCARSSS